MREVYFKFVGPHYLKMEAKDMTDKERQDRIWEHFKNLDKEMLEWEKQEEAQRLASEQELNTFYEGR